MKALPELLDDRAFESLKNYLRDDSPGLKLFQLSRRIAEMLGRYCLLRPDVILAWGRGRNPVAAEASSRWQSVLWRKILEQCPPEARGLDPAALQHRLMRSPALLPGLPERISVFGISTLAPYYIDIFIRLAEQADLNIYYMNPCRHYWEYVFSKKEISRFTADGVPEEAIYMEEGNALLASLGTAGREFFSLLLSRVGDAGQDLFVDPGRANMLATVQSDVLNLVDGCRETPLPVSPDDASIQVHSCHSPIREVEVLYDTLLAILEGHADIQPKDIVVMTPDISAYAPLIQAVFDTPERPALRIAYTLKQVNTVAGALLAVLSLDRGRYRAADVLDLLEHPAVRNRFGLGEQELDRAKKWVSAAGIRWGIDGRYRAGLGLPDFHENTWSFGLDRMLLGHALFPSSDEKMFAGILPYGQFEEDDSLILGKIAGFARALFARCRSLKSPRTLPEWAAVLNGILSEFFLAQDETMENDIMEIRQIILDRGLVGIYEKTGFKGVVSLDVIRDYLEAGLAGSSRASGFINNGVTFCTLLPMRSIPFKVVCMLGMNDGDFPRASRRPGFDLLEKQRRPCDFSKTFEDRYLFLESLLSARKFLIISHVGQDIRDNSRLPPSTLVRELFEYLAGRFTTGNGGNVLSQVVVEHPLQPFSPKYFQDNKKLFSYSNENHAAALRSLEQKASHRRLFERPLPEPARESWQPLAIDHLVAFFKNPTAFIMRNRLNLNLAVEETARAEEREPFSLDSLQQYLIRQDLVEFLVRYGQDDQTAFEIIKASGRLPHGSPGRIAWASNNKEARRFLEAVSSHMEGGAVEPENFECRLSDSEETVIQGVFDRLYPQGQLFYRCARIKAADILTTWIYHLALNAADKSGQNRTTRLIGSDTMIEFSAMEKEAATARLTELTHLFFEGLIEPLCFFPESSRALAEQIVAGKSGALARAAALRQWRSDERRSGEGDDVHISRCFDETVMVDEKFRRIALAVYGPVFKQIKK